MKQEELRLWVLSWTLPASWRGFRMEGVCVQKGLRTGSLRVLKLVLCRTQAPNGNYRANPVHFKPPHLECSDLYETIRDTVKWSNKMIQDVFLDTFFIVPDQEPSMSSKYWLQGQGLLDTLPIILESWNLHSSQDSHIMMICDIKDDLLPQVPGQEPSTSSKYGLRGWWVLDTLPIILESWNSAHE